MPVSRQPLSGPDFKHALDQWLSLQPGVRLLEEELAEVASALANRFGYHILQVGHRGSVDWISNSRIIGRMVLDIDCAPVAGRDDQVVCSSVALPVASDSVDVVVLPHVLEFESDPHQVLREVDRILIGEGHVVIVGFNPFSTWGLWRLLLARRGVPPWCGHFRSPGKLQDWLRLLGFDIVDLKFVCHRPPVRNQRLSQFLSGWEAVGNALLPFLGGAFILVGKKRLATVTPLATEWQRRPRLIASGFAKPTTRSVAGDSRRE